MRRGLSRLNRLSWAPFRLRSCHVLPSFGALEHLTHARSGAVYLFRLDGDKRAIPVREQQFSTEKELQLVCERNLDAIFGLRFVRSEFPLHTFRIDTLAYDSDAKAFVIIEYKRNERFSVVDQGYAYLSLMLNNKADFILEFNENQATNLRRDDVDWSQSKVVFVSPSFTAYQRESINFKDLPIELWEVRRYENQTLHFSQLRPTGASESIKTISKQSEEIQKVSGEVRVYTEEDHLRAAEERTVELYRALKDRTLSLSGDLALKPKKMTLAFALHKKVIADVHLQRTALKLWINLRAGDLEDPAGMARDVSSVGHWGNGDYEVRVDNDEVIDYVVGLVRQSLRKNTASK